MMPLLRVATAALLAASLLGAEPTLVILHARVADGTGAPLQDERVVVVAGDTIVAIEDAAQYRPPPGASVIDAKGLVVAPGFIDMHSHADDQILARSGAETQVRQGITTALGGQDGGCQCPLADFFPRVERAGTALNLASMAGFGTLRTKVMGADNRRPARPDEIERMKALLEAELRAGAFGLSSGLEYEPGSYASTDEIVEAAKVVKPYGGFYISHVRDEGRNVIAAHA